MSRWDNPKNSVSCGICRDTSFFVGGVGILTRIVTGVSLCVWSYCAQRVTKLTQEVENFLMEMVTDIPKLYPPNKLNILSSQISVHTASWRIKNSHFVVCCF